MRCKSWLDHKNVSNHTPAIKVAAFLLWWPHDTQPFSEAIRRSVVIEFSLVLVRQVAMSRKEIT